jgi:hypothetical protein
MAPRLPCPTVRRIATQNVAANGAASENFESARPRMTRRVQMSRLISSITVGLAAALLTQSAIAGGFLEFDGAVFDASSNQITNSWWPLPEGTRFTYFAEGVDECAVVVVDVLATADQSRTHVDGVAVREVRDNAWIDEDCDGIPEALHESTLDWYTQDTDGNVWYFGEDTVAFDFDECDHLNGDGNCTDGSWEAGLDVAGVGSIAEAGVVMLADPAANKGGFYFQEFYEDEALDMGKVLTLKKVATVLYGPQEGCAMIKEYSPLSPGEIEHKYYCEDLGLVVVEENSGGKTVFEKLISVEPIP